VIHTCFDPPLVNIDGSNICEKTISVIDSNSPN